MKYSDVMCKIYISKLKHDFKTDKIKLIRSQEFKYDKQVNNIANIAVKNNKHIILLTGPSSSGKTTTSKKLSNALEKLGKKVYRISLDNFYKESNKFPLWEDGTQNYESIDALDIDYFNFKLEELIKNKKALFPIYKFFEKTRSDKTFPVEYDEQTFLIFEGIHALNPLLTKNIKDCNKLKIYVSVHSNFVDNNGNVILSGKTLRLIRRTLRDSIYRGSNFDETFNLWKYVLRGEQLYIKPFKSSADIHINSTHSYEPFLFCPKIINLIKETHHNVNHQDIISLLMKASSHFEQLDEKLIPKNSLMQEFL